MPDAVLIAGARLVGDDGTLRTGDLRMEGGRIAQVGPKLSADGAELVKADGLILSPGLIDTQINGGYGYSFSGASAEDAAGVRQRLLEFGVTGLLPTLISLPRKAIRDGIRALVEAAKGPRGAEILGIHLEGPWLAPARRGAHQEKNLRKATLAEFEEQFAEAKGLLRMITLAPERKGALEVIAEGAKRGVIFSAGHTEATGEDFDRAVKAGVRHVTHLYNAMEPIQHRKDTLLGAALVDDRVSCGFIYDRIHISARAARLLLRAKPRGLAVLVSDTTLALGVPNGVLKADGATYFVNKGVVTVKGTKTIAGSACSILHGVRCLVADLGLTAGEALLTASAAPARLLGLKSKGTLREGADADVVLFDDRLHVQATYLRGARVHGNHH